jgi:hypothetical protein
VKGRGKAGRVAYLVRMESSYRGAAERAARVPEPGRPEELGCREGDEPGPSLQQKARSFQ